MSFSSENTHESGVGPVIDTRVIFSRDAKHERYEFLESRMGVGCIDGFATILNR